MEIIIEAGKIIAFVVFSFAALAGLVNGITGWREKKELKKLYLVSFVVWLTFIGFFYLISYL